MIQHGRVTKAALPLASDRAKMTDRVRMDAAKRPAAVILGGGAGRHKRRKRTPFTLNRVGAPFKRPSSRKGSGSAT